MTSEQLRNTFQSPFDINRWYNLLHDIFKASELKVTPEKINDDPDEEGYYLGNVATADYYRIGFFIFNIRRGSVANRRVGLRRLVRNFTNQRWGEFDAALVIFNENPSSLQNPDSSPWRLSFISDIKGKATAPKRYTYVFGFPDLLYKTPIERFAILQKKGITFENLMTAFSVEALSDEFFDKYREQYADFIQYITGKRFVKSGSKWEEKKLGEPNDKLMQAFNHDEKKIRDYIKKMMGRITFLHFLQRKGWMCGDLNYMQNMFQNSSYKNDYLDSVLEPLFFGVLNTKPAEREDLFTKYGWDKKLLHEWRDIPYLNGGLFERDDTDEPESRFPAEYFQRLFQFFSEYNFTIDENDPNDAEVGVDPEMLGKIFENLLEDNKDKGAFYTPKEIVRYMCQESLIAYIETNTTLAKDKIRQFVLTPEEGVAHIPDNKKDKLLNALKNVKICDPAIGSGAFPMGLLNELLKCREALSTFNFQFSTFNSTRSQLKKSIIQNNIYGVDIEKGAVDIARLRFWLSIVVDEEKASPLPNLDYKIMQGNSLIESYKGMDLSRLTYDNKDKSHITEYSIFDDDTNQLQRRVTQLLTQYYSCSDHEQKHRLQRDISHAISQQLELQKFDPAILHDLKHINLAENTHFFLWHTWFSDVFAKGGFDIVIGNPPYVKEYTNRKAFDGFREVSPYYMGKMDLWYGFACHGIDLLKQEGTLCFIAQNNWTTSAGAKKMRNKVISDSQILQLLDFNTYMVFENAEIQTMVMLFKRNRDVDDYEFDYRIITQCNEKEDMLALLTKRKRNTKYLLPIINRYALKDNLLTFSENNLIFDKITKDKTYLQDNEIAQGIVFPQDFLNKQGANKLGNKYPIGIGVFGLDQSEKDSMILNEKELELIQPYFTTEQIHRYYTDSNNTQWMIYTDSSFKNADKMKDYPHIKEHLDKFIEIFTSDNKPYGLHRCRKQIFFQGEKIISLRKCVGKPCFSYSNFDCYVTQTFFSIKSSRWNLKFLTGILNSKLIAFWLKNRGKMQGSNYQIDKEPLLGIPLPIIDLAIQQPIISLVESILVKMEQYIQTDISSEEREIDKLVYELYGLTEEEIRVVEGICQ